MKKGDAWKRGGVGRRVGRAASWPPFALPILYIVHIVPGQMRPIFSSEEVSVQRCTAVVGGQMDQHMAWALLFRCCECCVTLNKAQVHTFKSFMGQYGNLYRLLGCDVQSVPSLCFLKECVRHPCHIRFTTLSTAETLGMWAPSLHLTWQKEFFIFLCNYDSFYSARSWNTMILILLIVLSKLSYKTRKLKKKSLKDLNCTI